MLTIILGFEKLLALFCRYLFVVIGTVTVVPALLVPCVALTVFWAVTLSLIGLGYVIILLGAALIVFSAGVCLFALGVNL